MGIFHIEISTDNAAFVEAPAIECARILNDLVATLLEEGLETNVQDDLFDSNGNRVGTAFFIENLEG